MLRWMISARNSSQELTAVDAAPCGVQITVAVHVVGVLESSNNTKDCHEITLGAGCVPSLHILTLTPSQ